MIVLYKNNMGVWINVRTLVISRLLVGRFFRLFTKELDGGYKGLGFLSFRVDWWFEGFLIFL